MIPAFKLVLAALCTLVPLEAFAQSATNIIALRGLAPVSTLPNTPEGKAALAANLTVTGDIQTGTLKQPILLPFPEQEQLALRDCFITDGNATELADGLGRSSATCIRARPGTKISGPSPAPRVRSPI